MLRIYTSRLMNRSVAIHRIHREHGMDHGSEFLVYRRFPMERSNRNFVTLFSSKGRNFHLECHIQLSKRLNFFHHNRLVSRSSSGFVNPEKDITRDSMDGMSPIAPSVELSSEDVTGLDSNDSFTLFLDTFPQTIKENVNRVVSKVDDVHLNNATKTLARDSDGPGEKQERKMEKTEFSQTKSILRKRWQRIVRKEKERHYRRNRARSSKRQFHRGKHSIKTQWDEALRRNGYFIFPRSSGEEYNVEPPLDMLGTVNSLSEMDEREKILHNIDLSPIFRFRLYPQQSLIDFETTVAIGQIEQYNDSTNHIKVQRVVSDVAINDEEKEVDRTIAHNNAIFESISLLIAMRREDWRKYDSSVHLSVDRNITRGNKNSDWEDEMSAEQELVDDALYKKGNKTLKFLQYVMEHKHILTTSVVNLLLAHLLTSNEIGNQEIADSCLQIFEEMKMLGTSGQYECRPDSTTYRLLILAFSRRFQAMGEALKISQEMVEHSSIDISSELFNEAMKVCRAKTELNVARVLMDCALSNNRIRIDAASCIIYTEMLKTRKLDEEAVELFRRVKKANLLSQLDEDEYLISLCRWPQRSRRGDVLDLSFFWTDIMDILEQKILSGKIPDIRVWLTFLEGLYDSAKNDDSLWQMAADATRTVLDVYPRSFVGRKLMTVGLDASSRIEDTELISLLLKRLANEPSISTNKSSFTVKNSETTMRPAKVPFRALKNSLGICLKTSDAKSAQSILESMNQIGDPYPSGAQYELYSLVLKCHAKVNDAENAKGDLRMMMEKKMKPSEELYSEVLRTMAAVGRYIEMEELFQSMQSGNEDGIEPGISSFDAILSTRVKEKSWDGVFSLYDEMKAKEVKPSPYTVKGLIIANDQKGGRKLASSALESLLLSNAQFDESTFRLASKILFQDVDENLDDFRKKIREIGEDRDLRDPSLDLVRSIRFAEIESGRPKSVHGSKNDLKHAGEDAWQSATSKLLFFSRALLERKDDIE